MASAAVSDAFASRDDARKQKQLQEARAAGTAAPETDEATGKIINPHNPMFITQAPWYLNQSKTSLKHQQAWNLKAPGTKEWYKRGTVGDVKTKFIKGACENCGATTHTKKDCVERPRAVSAKTNGKNLMPDEYVETLELDYEGKRDRWNGFQPDDYKAVLDDWERTEQERRKRKAAEMEERAKLKERLKAQKKILKKKRKQRRRVLRRQAEGREEEDSDTGTGDSDTAGDSDTDTDTDSDSDASDDEDLGEKMKDFDKNTATVATKDDKLRTTTRNLRIREDTAKYLLNLDVNSAYYDPKSRSMRDDPLKHLKDDEKGSFRGDNFVRTAGDTKALTELMCFAWDSYKQGGKVHDTAQPTQALKMFQVYKQRSKDLKADQQKELLEKYGGEEHLNAPQEVIFSQNDNYVEYTRDGRVLKGRERAYVKSKYEEDVLIGNHSSPWGSWFDPASGKWGFACCHQCMKNSYCVPLKQHNAVVDAEPAGEAEAADAAAAAGSTAAGGATAAATGQAAAAAGGAAGGDEDVSSGDSDDDSGEDGAAEGEDAEKRKQAIAEKRRARALAGLKLQKEAAGQAAASSSAAPAAPAEDENASKLSDQRTSAFGHVLEDITELDDAKLKKAVELEKKRRKEEKKAKAFSLDDERQRKFNASGADVNAGEISPEEYEAYRLTKQRSDDPMAKFV